MHRNGTKKSLAERVTKLEQAVASLERRLERLLDLPPATRTVLPALVMRPRQEPEQRELKFWSEC